MRPKVLVLGLVLLAPMLGGCWDVEEIDSLDVVVALGFDAAEDGRVLISAQLPQLQRLLSPSAGGASSGKDFAYALSTEADTVYEALTDLETKASRRIFLGQLKAIVIGAALARRGLKPYVDFLERQPKIPPQAVVILAKGKAKDIIAAQPRPENLPALSLMGLFRSPLTSDQVFELRKAQLLHALDTSKEEPEEAFLPLISFDKQERTFVLRGLAVFRRDRMVGELSGREARMFLLMTAKARHAHLPLDLGEMGRVTYRGVRAGRKITPLDAGDRLGFLVEVQIHGYLVEMTKPVAPMGIRLHRSLESATAGLLKREMEKMVGRLQELNSDILGLGELLRASRPQIWRRIDWGEEFPRAKVSIEVHFEVGRTGTER